MKGDKPFRVLIVEDEVLLAAELEYLVAASGAAPIGPLALCSSWRRRSHSP